MTRRLLLAVLCLAIAAPALAQSRPIQPGETDQTLRAMRDEMKRSRERLVLPDSQPPYYIEYKLLDVDIRTVSTSFGALVSSNTGRNRYMAVDVRVGDYQLDSSNFISGDAFRGFLGSTGMVGIDRDYDSLRQDLWLGTDQAYKDAVDRLGGKLAYLRSLARRPTTPDFSRAEPVVRLEPLAEPDWTARDWEAEAKAASAVFRQFPQLHNSQVDYYLVYTTYYVMTSEGTEIRTRESMAAIEAAIDTQSDDTGMRMSHFWTFYALRPHDLPRAEEVRRELERIARELVALRAATLATDYVGPVLFEPEAAGALLAQLLAPAVSGARPPLSMVPFYDQMMERLGGRSEWLARMGTRVLPAEVSLVSDPTAKSFRGQPLLGHYEVDAEGVAPERVTIVENGTLRTLLMSRRPGQEIQRSNGHARSVFLSEPRPAMSNLFFESAEGESPAALREKFLQLCRAEGHDWCILVRRMDNPGVSAIRSDEGYELMGSLATGAASGDRLPLLVYRVHVADGREELIRGARLTGLTLRSLRNIAGIGNDPAVFNYYQNVQGGLTGTALGAFGSAPNGLPTSIVAPSLLLEDVEVRGARGEPRRPPIVPPPPLQ